MKTSFKALIMKECNLSGMLSKLLLAISSATLLSDHICKQHRSLSHTENVLLIIVKYIVTNMYVHVSGFCLCFRRITLYFANLLVYRQTFSCWDSFVLSCVVQIGTMFNSWRSVDVLLFNVANLAV